MRWAVPSSGNNNAYCQDDELSWYDWEDADHDLLSFTRTVLALRRNSPALRPPDYLRGPEGGPAQIVLYRVDGEQMGPDDWNDADANALAVRSTAARSPTTRARPATIASCSC